MRVFSYVVARDYGFAPNPFWGYCTLATCKPQIRNSALAGDWVVGTGSVKYSLHENLVYAMRVTEAMTYEDYWRDPRFLQKRPVLNGSTVQWFGDNIYHRNPRTRRWMQESSHHSRDNGRPNRKNIERDTSTDRVLVSDDYVYFGRSAPRLPAQFRRIGSELWKNGAGHKCNFPETYVERIVAWIRSLDVSGCVDDPAEFAEIRQGV